jgi:hypothetical protein
VTGSTNKSDAPYRLSVDMTEDREHLLKCIAPGGRCSCGEPAVVRYVGGGTAVNGQRSQFCWVRCGSCPGTRRPQGLYVEALPMEPHHRSLLKLLGDEEAFLAAARLGYRPEAYGSDGTTIEGHVDIELWRWETDW